jgi:hypothetical protein
MAGGGLLYLLIDVAAPDWLQPNKVFVRGGPAAALLWAYVVAAVGLIGWWERRRRRRD